MIADVARLRPHTPEGPLKISSEIESAGSRVLVERQPRRKPLVVGARANFQKHREPEELSDRIAPFRARPDRIQSGRQVFGTAEQPESGFDSSSGSVDRVGQFIGDAEKISPFAGIKVSMHIERFTRFPNEEARPISLA